MKEVYKDITGFEGYYQVSNFGNIKSLDRYINQINHLVLTKRHVKERILKHKIKANGYPSTHLIKGSIEKYYSVHRLVAIAFIPNPKHYPEVNHIDGNKENNTFSNLEWCTSKYNHEHAKKTGLAHHTDGRNGFAKSVINVKTKVIFPSAKLAYLEFNPPYGYIYFTRKLSGDTINDTPYKYSKSPMNSLKQYWNLTIIFTKLHKQWSLNC